MNPTSRSTQRRHPTETGFTLVEIMIVVVIIGLLAALAIPAFRRVQRRAQATTVANNLRQFGQAIETYATEAGTWPPDTASGVPPAVITDRLRGNVWAAGIPGGHAYDWDAHVNGITAALSIIGGDRNDPLFLAVDRILDDGNTATGNFRWVNDRYMLILQP